MIATAEGDASRFKQILTEYNKAPEVTRQRLYLETVQQVYANTSKVMIDAKGGGNLLYLPLDKLMQTAAGTQAAAAATEPTAVPAAPVAGAVSSEVPPQMEKAPAVQGGGDYRSRSSLNSRDRGDR